MIAHTLCQCISLSRKISEELQQEKHINEHTRMPRGRIHLIVFTSYSENNISVDEKKTNPIQIKPAIPDIFLLSNEP